MYKLLMILLSIAGLVCLGSGVAVVASPPATADPCVGSWSIGVGGFVLGIWSNGFPSDFQESLYMGVDQRVGYHTLQPQAGLNELDRLFWQHRNECPTDHIKLIGHSEGAALVHAWVTQHQWVDNANAVLLADPKLYAWEAQGSARFAPAQFGPVAGVDDWFGDFPVLTICRWDDIVCRAPDAGVWGYATGTHLLYDMNAWAYGDWDRGVVMA